MPSLFEDSWDVPAGWQRHRNGLWTPTLSQETKGGQAPDVPDTPTTDALNKVGLRFIYAGFFTLVAAVGTCVYLSFQIILGVSTVQEFFGIYGIPLVLVGASVAFCLFGYLILRSVGLANRPVIPPQDRDALIRIIEKRDDVALNMYMNLSSLSGASGFFAKIGVKGLPLATIFLSLVFAIFALLPLGLQQTFSDLAKLTLGAFLGSYVQRQQEATPVQPGAVPPNTPNNAAESGR